MINQQSAGGVVVKDIKKILQQAQKLMKNSKKIIKAILFDMVGVLIFKKLDYSAFTINQINADKIEKLYNHVDDQKLLADIKENLNLGKE